MYEVCMDAHAMTYRGQRATFVSLLPAFNFAWVPGILESL